MEYHYSQSVETDREVCFYCACEVLPGSNVYLARFNEDIDYWRVFDSEDCRFSNYLGFRLEDLVFEERLLHTK